MIMIIRIMLMMRRNIVMLMINIRINMMMTTLITILSMMIMTMLMLTHTKLLLEMVKNCKTFKLKLRASKVYFHLKSCLPQFAISRNALLFLFFTLTVSKWKLYEVTWLEYRHLEFKLFSA